MPPVLTGAPGGPPMGDPNIPPPTGAPGGPPMGDPNMPPPTGAAWWTSNGRSDIWQQERLVRLRREILICLLQQERLVRLRMGDPNMPPPTGAPGAPPMGDAAAKPSLGERVKSFFGMGTKDATPPTGAPGAPPIIGDPNMPPPTGAPGAPAIVLICLLQQRLVLR